MDVAGRYPLLTPAETLRLASIIQNPETKESKRLHAVNKLVKCNLRLIPGVARKIMANKRTYKYGDNWTEDFLQSGTLGLTRAAEKYDPTKGYAFSTYAMPWIYQAIQRTMYNGFSMVRVPESSMRDYYRYVNEQWLPDKNEDVFIARMIDAHNALHCKSLQTLVLKNDDDTCLEDFLADETHAPIAEDTFDELLAKAPLSRAQREVLYYVFVKSMTKADAYALMEVQREIGRKIFDSAILKLRRAICR